MSTIDIPKEMWALLDDQPLVQAPTVSALDVEDVASLRTLSIPPGMDVAW
ncbi:hypothetical protein SNOG_07934 [Parastagonospora nodorum SN15]|uniref:Uncharacterized protein n=1 Tax=Phaeosphaeria nodorum (strain SN15 / ATCC MYA-4574 / FGSC 10173) TaxID=321614 RepID=Q0UJY0_PHANO|nr:hypothetical protein SNOG_07934 [Parastagonospora nodorum SN15]EAT84210.1 hypothetical protein SNOG_07934 [Parastagonospora nodorum SN15]